MRDGLLCFAKLGKRRAEICFRSSIVGFHYEAELLARGGRCVPSG